MIRPQRSPALWLPLRYLATGMLAWVLAAAGVPWLAAHLVAGFDDPKIFALTHLVVLGWVTMTIMGALYQLFPVALQASLAAPKVGRWNFVVYAAGVAGFVPSFYFGLLRHRCGCREGNVGRIAANGGGILAGWARGKRRSHFSWPAGWP